MNSHNGLSVVVCRFNIRENGWGLTSSSLVALICTSGAGSNIASDFVNMATRLSPEYPKRKKNYSLHQAIHTRDSGSRSE
jgi:hypothetical protein